jgi:hypothetical protein
MRSSKNLMVRTIRALALILAIPALAVSPALAKGGHGGGHRGGVDITAAIPAVWPTTAGPPLVPIRFIMRPLLLIGPRNLVSLSPCVTSTIGRTSGQCPAPGLP